MSTDPREKRRAARLKDREQRRAAKTAPKDSTPQDPFKGRVRGKKTLYCGIYRILNTKTGQHYIGQSIDVFGRWNGHLAGLLTHTHHCVKFQAAFHRAQLSDWTFSILEVCTKEELKRKEDAWLLRYDLDPLLLNTARPKGSKAPKAKKITE